MKTEVLKKAMPNNIYVINQMKKTKMLIEKYVNIPISLLAFFTLIC